MNTARRCAYALALLGTGVSAWSVEPAPAGPGATARGAAPAASAASAPDLGPHDKRVIEDDKVRIEESRLRGQTQTVTVQSKMPGVKAYEVILPPLGKDPSQDKGAAGKRTWSIFDF